MGQRARSTRLVLASLDLGGRGRCALRRRPARLGVSRLAGDRRGAPLVCGVGLGARIAPLIPDPRDAPGASARLFATGHLAVLTTGHWAVPELRAAVAAGRLRVGFVALPHRGGAAPATALFVSAYAVRARTSRRKGAVELVATLSDSLAGAVRGAAGVELPAQPAAAQALAAADTLGWEAAFLRAAAHGRPGWGARVGPWPEVEAQLQDMMDRIVLLHADAGRAARATARDLDRLLGATR